MEHLDGIFEIEPEFYPIASLQPGIPDVVSIVYRDTPEPAMVTGVTYGLSEVSHPDWKYGRPEMMITVESADIRWAKVIAFVASRLRGDCPFRYGDTINFREQVAPESAMNAFFVFAPSIIDNEYYT